VRPVKMRAIVACHNDNGHSSALLLDVWPPAVSPEDPWGYEFEASGGSRYLEDLGFPAPPTTGLWIWEGFVHYGIYDLNSEWRGQWRRTSGFHSQFSPLSRAFKRKRG